MKKLTTLTVLFAVSIILSLSSCGNKTVQASILQAYYNNALHTFNSANGMYIYQTANYSIVSGTESGTNSSLALTYSGTNTGMYPLGPSYSNQLTLSVGSTVYSSMSSGSYGTINVTQLNSGSGWLTGNFSGTFYNSAGTDSVKIPQAQSLISVRYQF